MKILIILLLPLLVVFNANSQPSKGPYPVPAAGSTNYFPGNMRVDGTLQVTNNLVVGTNGMIHSTNIFQVATPKLRNTFEVTTDDKVFVNTNLTVGGLTNTALKSQVVYDDGGGQEVALQYGGSATLSSGTLSAAGCPYTFLATGNNSPVAAATYYFGSDSSRTLNTDQLNGAVDVYRSGNLKRVQFKMDFGSTKGSANAGEKVEFSIYDLTTATMLLSVSNFVDGSVTNFVVTGSAAVSQGDLITYRFRMPGTMTTTPVNLRTSARAYIE